MSSEIDIVVGERIARGRRRRGWYQRDLGLAVGRSESWVSQVERGLLPVDSLATAEAIAAALRLDVPYVLALDVRYLAAPQQAAVAPPAVPDVDRADWMSVLRRVFVTGAGGMLVDAVLGASPLALLADAARGESRPALDPGMLEDLRSVGEVYRRSYRAVPSETLLPLALGQIRLVFSLAPASQPELARAALQRHVGEMAALAGVVHMLDLGDFQAADPLLRLASNCGKQIGDRELVAVAYGCRAFHAGYGGDARESLEEGLDWAQAAQEAAWSGASPRTTAWTCAVASEMHASLGDADGAFEALDAARRALDRPAQDERWAGIGWLDEAKLEAYEGGDLVRLGRHGQAIERLTAALDALAPTMARHRATALVDRADALAGSGDMEAACRDAIQALETVEQVHHAETMRRITNVARVARGHQSSAARALREHLMEVRSTQLRPAGTAGNTL
jgi:transcriptional regulator with XRE-family HTH domain